MKPGERIRLIKEAAESLNERPWHEIQLTLRAHDLPTYELDDQWSPDQLTYCAQQVEQADDKGLIALHDYLLGDDAAPTPQQSSDRPWGSNPVAVFISHRHEDAQWVSAIRDILGRSYGIDAFVAHNDIHPSATWRATIRSALSSCHFMVAVLHEKFHESQWCDQEVGWALGRGVPVLPVRRQPNTGPRYDGFMEEHQDLVLGPVSQFGSGEHWLAERIFNAVVTDPKTRTVGIKALAEAFVNSTSFDNTRRLWAVIAAVDQFGSDQLRRLEYAVQTNRQVYDANVDGVFVPDLVKQLIDKFEPPQPVTGFGAPVADPWDSAKPAPTTDPWATPPN